MATSAATLVQRTRRFLQDWPEGDSLTASCTSLTTTLTVADGTLYAPGWLIQVGTEGMQVRAGAGTSVTVLRGARGSTQATHASGDTVLVRPRFLDVQYLDAINSGINAAFPWLYQPVIDESLTATSTAYEYNVPSLNSVPIPYISKVFLKESSDLTFREFQGWTVRRGSTPVIQLKRPLTAGTLRVYGFGPLPTLTGLTDSLSTLFPVNAEDALTLYAAQWLLAASEAARVREDTGPRDQRDNANRPGSSIQAANQIFTRFQQRLMASGMPPMPKHVVSTL